MSPLDRYPTGVLHPIDPGLSGIDPASAEEGEAEPGLLDDPADEPGAGGESDDEPLARPPRRRRYVPPSSVGFSCYIRGDVRLEITASAAIYQGVGERGEGGRFRSPEYTRTLLPEQSVAWSSVAGHDGSIKAIWEGRAGIDVRARPHGDGLILTVTLCNRSELDPDAPPRARTLDRVGKALFEAQAVERLVRWREDGCAGSAESVLLDHLAEASASLDPRVQAGIRKLHDTLESLTGLGDATASELFERHDTPLGRAMTLFFLRRAGADLFEYRSDRLGEPDWLAAAILFGVRDGWLDLPLRLRDLPGLAHAVSHRMARMSHRMAGSGLDLGEPPARVLPLRERFGDGSAWRPDARAAALELARLREWDCVFTRISLGAGEYTLTVKGGSLHIELPGEPRISPDIDSERFFDYLASARLDSGTEAKVRAKLRG